MIEFIVFDLVFPHKIRYLHLKTSYNTPPHCTLNKSLVWFALYRVTILNPQFVECLWFAHHLSFVPAIVYGSSIYSYPSSSLLRHLPVKFKFDTILFILYLLIKFKYTIWTYLLPTSLSINNILVLDTLIGHEDIVLHSCCLFQPRPTTTSRSCFRSFSIWRRIGTYRCSPKKSPCAAVRYGRNARSYSSILLCTTKTRSSDIGI